MFTQSNFIVSPKISLVLFTNLSISECPCWYCVHGADPYGKLRGDVSRAAAGVLRIEVGIWLTQEVRFQHIATLSIR